VSDLIDGKYEVIAKIKEGGMGAIFKVRHVLLDEVRVIKTMKPQIEDDPDARKRFHREARLATNLKHPHIASLIDFVEDRDHTFYMVMEFIDGVNLAEYINLKGVPPIATTLGIGIQTADALGYLHRKGIVHRDISPENIMLTQDPQRGLTVKLIDLGVAKDTEQGMTMTNTGMFVGKLKYGSPEQLGVLKSGERIDGRSDIYSLGCVLYLALTGKQPFTADNPQGYILQHVVHGPRSFDDSDPEGTVPDEIRAVVLKALAKKREERYATAEEFVQALSFARKRHLARAAGLDPSRVSGMAGDETPSVIRALGDDVDGNVLYEIEDARLDMVDPPTDLDSHQRKLSRAFGNAAQPPTSTRLPQRPQATVAIDTRRAREAAVAAPPAPAAPKALLLAAAAVLIIAAGVGAFLVARARFGGSAPAGTLLLTARPWGRVVAVVSESNGRKIEVGDVVTPARLVLPAGRYRITVRGRGAAAETEASTTLDVVAAAETTAHVNIEGFDLEEAVRSYVP